MVRWGMGGATGVQGVWCVRRPGDIHARRGRGRAAATVGVWSHSPQHTLRGRSRGVGREGACACGSAGAVGCAIPCEQKVGERSLDLSTNTHQRARPLTTPPPFFFPAVPASTRCTRSPIHLPRRQRLACEERQHGHGQDGDGGEASHSGGCCVRGVGRWHRVGEAAGRSGEKERGEGRGGVRDPISSRASVLVGGVIPDGGWGHASNQCDSTVLQQPSGRRRAAALKAQCACGRATYLRHRV